MIAGAIGLASGVMASGYPHGGTITYIDAPIAPFSDNFNPFSGSYALGSSEIDIYEPLLFFNDYTEKVVPKLAAKYTYSDGNRVITMQLRKGVRWSDGRPFTSADVVFTYRAILAHPAIDLSGVSSDLKSVTALGRYAVRFTLKHPNTPFLYYLAGSVPIVPAHVWQGKNPVTFTNTNPVTTGPWLVQSENTNQVVLKANPHYWNAPEPYVQTIVVPAYLSNTSADLAMVQGKWDMGQQFIPNLKSALLAKNSNYHFWFPPTFPATIWTNDATYPLSLVPLRRAISLSINRQLVSAIGEYGYEKPVNLTGLPLPTFARWVPPSLLKKFAPTYSPARAKTILKAAGFRWNAQGRLVDPKGQVVSFTLLAPSGATDYVSDCKLVASELGAIGLNVTVSVPTVSTEIADLQSGNFQLALLWTPTVGPGPYFLYDSMYSSVFTAPVGKTAVSNYERWNNPATDRLLNAFAQTRDPAKEKAIMAQLETIIGNEQPTIPLVGGVAWEEYNTAHIVGWPSAQNPYDAFASAWDYEYIFAQVHRK